eukprot:1873147-Rhodomonas_salina.1
MSAERVSAEHAEQSPVAELPLELSSQRAAALLLLLRAPAGASAKGEREGGREREKGRERGRR